MGILAIIELAGKVARVVYAQLLKLQIIWQKRQDVKDEELIAALDELMASVKSLDYDKAISTAESKTK